VTPELPPIFVEWLAQLEARHLADLRVPEVTRALRALSSAYVERRHKVTAGATLDTAGKRAAFALFYAPLHFLATLRVIEALDAATPAPTGILDLGCGTGAAGAAWAIAAAGRPSVTGIDRHPWAIQETKWNFRLLGIDGQARQGDLTRLPPAKRGTGIVAAYVLNELAAPARERIESYLIDAASAGVTSLVLEPIARSVTPWWDPAASRVTAAGGRADEWKFPVELPPVLRLFDRAAGLNHREIKLRTLYLPGR
jgi:tRNA/tmRNA/rRNA uracil-C5-methylase (TrmA/RlmC/RlmD family)